MKKKIAIALITLMTVSMLAGCGENNSEKEGAVSTETVTSQEATGEEDTIAASAVVLKDYPVEKYVTLGDYKGIDVEIQSAAVSEEDVDAMAMDFYISGVTAENGGITDRAVEEGDTVNIDYCGKLDGEAFAGGTATDSDLTIGSHTFIDGFEDQLIGVMPGESPALDLTFPEAYHSAELAGKAVVFDVTVNFIYPTEMVDEVVAGFGLPEFSTVADLKQYVRDYLEATAQSQVDAQKQNAVLNQVVNNATFSELPADLLAHYRSNISDSITMESAQYGVDNDTFCSYYYGMRFEDFLDVYSDNAVKQNLVCQAIANQENLNMSDEELDAQLMEYATLSGLDSIEAFIGDQSKEEYREYFMFQKVIEFLAENASVTVTE